jgi:hypothetical protein
LDALSPNNQGETIMATTTTSKKIPETFGEFTEGFGDAADRYRAINEKLVETGKKTASAAVEGYEKSVASSSRRRRSSTGSAPSSRRRTTSSPSSLRHTPPLFATS